MSRILAVDYGTRRVGLAISDEDRSMAFPRGALLVQDPADAVRQVAAFAREHEVAEVLVGMPVNMNGTRGPMAEAAERFAQALGVATGLKVTRWDERMSTQQAERMLIAADVSRQKRKTLVDALAAQQMLVSFLESREGQGAP